MPQKNQGRTGRGRLVRLLPLVLLVAVGIQLPIIWALSRLSGHPFLILAATAALTGAFASGLARPRSVWGAPGPARLYLVLWPFFVWWTMALLFAVLLPFALALRALGHAPMNATLAVNALVAALGAAFSLRQRPRVRAHDIVVAGLPQSFDGYRIVQISDLHCGPFAGAQRVAGWVAAVNRQAPDLVAVTGDLIASGTSFVPVVAAALRDLSARDGVFVSMGNHDYFTDGEGLVRALEEVGLPVLRNRGVEIQRGGAALHVAGVDDTWSRRAEVSKALSGRRAGVPTVLLAHDPVLFPEAARAGVELTLSGHTHGGQLGMPFLSRRLNLARLFTSFTTGLYRSGSSTLYVNRGLGTTGPPVRLAVAPEIAVLTLRRGSAPAVQTEGEDGSDLRAVTS